MIKHLDISVSGRVQGVVYRFWAQSQAESLGISGFAQNLPDGSVLIEAEGEEKNLEKFVKLCHDGPPFAKVENVVVKEGDLKNYPEFEVK